MTQEDNKGAAQENARASRPEPCADIHMSVPMTEEIARQLRALERHQRPANLERDPDLMLEHTQGEAVPGAPTVFSLRFTRGDGAAFSFQIDHVQAHALSDRLLTIAIRLAAEREGAAR